jgi:hypothetical protein
MCASGFFAAGLLSRSVCVPFFSSSGLFIGKDKKGIKTARISFNFYIFLYTFLFYGASILAKRIFLFSFILSFCALCRCFMFYSFGCLVLWRAHKNIRE